jgi:hypothetical protein
MNGGRVSPEAQNRGQNQAWCLADGHVNQQQLASANGLRELLVRRGFEVRTAGIFNDLAGWLMLYGESTILVLELPAIDIFRTAVTAGREPVLEEEPE